MECRHGLTIRILSVRLLSVCPSVKRMNCNKKLIRRWDSERELPLRRHCTRIDNTIDTCKNSATDRFLQRRFTKFSEITQCNGNYTPFKVIQGRSRSSKVTEFGANRKLICDFLLVIYTNLYHILHRFRDIAFERSKIAIFGSPLGFNPPTKGFPWDDLRDFF